MTLLDRGNPSSGERPAAKEKAPVRLREDAVERRRPLKHFSLGRERRFWKAAGGEKFSEAASCD